jgi:hypothetical protein
MFITWEDRKNKGKIDKQALYQKPELSFTYAWFLVTDDTAQFVETHAEGTYNEDMSDTQKAEVIAFYNTYVRPAKTIPIYDSATQKLVDSTTTEVIDGLTYATYDVVDIPQEEIIKKKVNTFTSTIDNYIQSKIDDYNNTNGTKFVLLSVSDYLFDTEYAHYGFCREFTMWRVGKNGVWETARAIQQDVLAGNRAEPTTEELLAELPELTY